MSFERKGYNTAVAGESLERVLGTDSKRLKGSAKPHPDLVAALKKFFSAETRQIYNIDEAIAELAGKIFNPETEQTSYEELRKRLSRSPEIARDKITFIGEAHAVLGDVTLHDSGLGDSHIVNNPYLERLIEAKRIIDRICFGSLQLMSKIPGFRIISTDSKHHQNKTDPGLVALEEIIIEDIDPQNNTLFFSYRDSGKKRKLASESITTFLELHAQHLSRELSKSLYFALPTDEEKKRMFQIYYKALLAAAAANLYFDRNRPDNYKPLTKLPDSLNEELLRDKYLRLALVNKFLDDCAKSKIPYDIALRIAKNDFYALPDFTRSMSELISRKFTFETSWSLFAEEFQELNLKNYIDIGSLSERISRLPNDDEFFSLAYYTLEQANKFKKVMSKENPEFILYEETFFLDEDPSVGNEGKLYYHCAIEGLSEDGKTIYISNQEPPFQFWSPSLSSFTLMQERLLNSENSNVHVAVNYTDESARESRIKALDGLGARVQA